MTQAAQLVEAPTTQTLNIQGMSCAACQIHVQRALEAVPGVDSATVNLMAHTAQITTHSPLDPVTLITAVRTTGYDASLPSTTSEPSQLMDRDNPRLGLRTLLALLAGAAAMLLSMPLMIATNAGAPHLASEMWVINPVATPASSAAFPPPLSHWMSDAMPTLLTTIPVQPIRWILFTLALATMLFLAPEIYTAAFRAARHRSTNMNTLVALGTLAAFASSFAATIAPAYFARRGLASDVYYEAVVLILAFLLTGRWLEARARTRATSALRGFAQLESSDARLLTPPPNWVPQVSPLRPGNDETSDYSTLPETLLPLSAIEPNDLIRVLPGDRIPLDGLILHGRSSIDESMLTGEPLPRTRSIGDHVSGGTLNLDGPLVLRATAVGAASTLAQIRRLLAQAQSSRAPLQGLADRASAIFVPTVLALAALTFTVWAIAENTAGRHEGFARALSIAIAVLIIACPCAMGLAVPAAITVSLGRAAQSGLLIKGGDALERLATVDTIALDKTGTLTLGQPTIAAFVLEPTASLDAATLLTYAAAAERQSTHPLAKAVVHYATQQHPTDTEAFDGSGDTQVPQGFSLGSHLPSKEGGASAPAALENLTNLPGIGLTTTIAGHHLSLGNASLLTTAAPTPPANLTRATPLYLLLDNHLQATFYATDELRPTAAPAIAHLKTLHVHPILLTGDTTASATPIAHQAGIEDIQAHLLPAGKLAAIRTLQQQGHRVAMVGDGINDAAALAQSDAGLAMASGSDLAREAGDILLLHTDLNLIPLAIRLARRTTHIMRQNLGWALLYNVIGIPLAAGVFYPHFHILLSPILASIAMALSSVSVLGNSLRLRRLP
jgi:Cu+-exporting ATPase